MGRLAILHRRPFRGSLRQNGTQLIVAPGGRRQRCSEFTLTCLDDGFQIQSRGVAARIRQACGDLDQAGHCCGTGQLQNIRQPARRRVFRRGTGGAALHNTKLEVVKKRVDARFPQILVAGEISGTIEGGAWLTALQTTVPEVMLQRIELRPHDIFVRSEIEGRIEQP